MKALEQFHINNATEYKHVIEDFNLMFYGYGCKEKVLKRLFPKSITLNCYGLKSSEVASQIRKAIIKACKPKNTSKYTLLDINTFFETVNTLFTREESLILILINFRKEFTFLINSNIKLVGTMETIDCTYEDMYDYNFIFRDLTTYCPYTTEIQDINLDTEIKKFLVVENLLNSVSKKAGDIFIATLKTFSVNTKISFPSLISKVGRKFLITTLASIKDHLHEFFDHKVFKYTGDGAFIINLNKSDVDKILEVKRINDVEKK